MGFAETGTLHDEWNWIMVEIFVVVIIILLLLLLITYRIRLAIDKPKIQQVGDLVEVEGQKMNIYAEGPRDEGDPLIVIMPESANPSPLYNYKKLYDYFTDPWRIAVVERFGYGYSDVTRSPRDVATVMEQSRKALSLAGEEPPYVLMPHGIAGLEALYWAQQYPNEVKGIIGLDMAIPAQYEKKPLGIGLKISTKLMSGACQIFGLQRLSLVQNTIEIFDKKELSKEEWAQEKYVIRKMAYNRMIYDELAWLHENAKFVTANGLPSLPLLLINSDGKEMPRDWKKAYAPFLAHMPEASEVELICGHNLHAHHPDLIAEASYRFLNELD